MIPKDVTARGLTLAASSINVTLCPIVQRRIPNDFFDAGAFGW
jgi:hypothetical protein